MIDPCKPDYSNTPISPLRPRYSYCCADPDAMPVVSIITPFRNTGPVFRETAASVFGQSLQQWEWLILDDASDDPESLAVLEACVRADARVRVIRLNVRGGPGRARNIAAAQARSSYLAFIDSDDLYEPTALEKWLWFLQSHPHFAMVKGFQVGFGAEEYLWREGFHSGAALLEQNLVQTACLIRREVYKEVGGMDEAIVGGMEDWDFWLRCANAGSWGGTVPEFLDWYRRRPTHSDRWQDWDSGERQAAFRQQLKARYPNLLAGPFPEPRENGSPVYAELPDSPRFANFLTCEEGKHKLLIVVPHLVAGGSDKYVLDLMSELIARHDYEISVVATRESEHPWRHWFETLTPDVFTLNSFLQPRDYPRFLAYLIRSRRIDSVLVTHSEWGYRLLPFLRAECPGVRCYDYVHIEEPDWKAGGYPAFSITYQSFLDHTVASSQHLREWMTEQGAQREKISVVNTNIDTEAWRRDAYDGIGLRMKWSVPSDTPVLLFTGRLCAQKQPDVLAHTLKDLQGRGLSFVAFIAGYGERQQWLQDFVNQHRLDGVRLLGPRANDEIRELLAISDVFFLPSLHEGIALTLFEAMAMGVVPVSARVGGQEELVTPGCGVLIERGPEESKRYADVIEKLLRDTVMRSQMAEAARCRVVECFPLSRMSEQMAAILTGSIPGTAPKFDLESASRALVRSHTREIIEQYRLERLADVLWSERCRPHPEPAPPPQQQPQPSAAKANGLAALATLRPLFSGRTHRRNRQLLFRILLDAYGRRELLAAFDRHFYAEQYPDVPRPSLLPLLHYVFYGYREGRLPSPDFPVEAGNRDPVPESINPLLLKIDTALRNADASFSRD